MTPPDEVTEFRLAAVEARLREGAGSFSKLRQAIDATNDRITAETRPHPAKLVAAIVGVCVFVCTLVWYAARYPDRDEFNASQESNATKLEHVKTNVGTIEREQIRLRGAVERLEQGQGRLESKLDAALEGRRR